MPPRPPSEVKGVWFVTARRLLASKHPGAVAEMVRLVDADLRSALTDPLPSSWYPEEALRQMLTAMNRVVANGDKDVFLRLMEEATDLGIQHFFRILVRIGSPAFVLKRVPTMWRQIRRGAGKVEVEADDRRATLRYTEFPWFSDPLYRLMTLGSLAAVVRLCAGRDANLAIVDHGPDWLTVRIEYD
jgi:hypothetical protein